MFEVATLSGNNIDSACALKAKTKSIMGQIISSATGKDNKSGGSLYGSRRSSMRKSKRESQKQDAAMESILRAKNEANRSLNNGQVAPLPDRPVTINAFRYENNSNPNTSEDIINHSKESTTIRNKLMPFSSKEFHKSGESYHKTGVCYYKAVDGAFHKLPHDSYHKMTEMCYVKLQNGSFRRFEDITNAIAAAEEDQVQLRVKNHVKRFLNRSKSHTPATIKEKQRQQHLKEKELPEVPSSNSTYSQPSSTQHNNTAPHHNQQPQNRRVMVTMIEGGMPVVATSKTGHTKSAKAKNRNSVNKVNK